MSKSVRLNIEHKGDLTIVGVGDTHFPFCDRDKLKEVYSIIKAHRPTHIVQVGDLYDMYSFSRFSRSLDLVMPKKELEEGRKQTVEMWEMITKLSPNSKKFQLRGNHSARIWKKIMDRAPEYESLLEEPINQLFDYPGVTAMKDSRSELVINGIVFNHGWKTTIGAHMQWYGQNTVVGHLHRGGVVFKPMKTEPLFELNCGHIADVNQLPLEYGDTKTSSWVAGCGVIDKYGPRFIAL